MFFLPEKYKSVVNPLYNLTLVFFCALFFFTSCATKPQQKAFSPLDFFAFFIDEGASVTENDVYVLIPVAENQAFLHKVLENSLPKKTAAELVSRTNTIYAALSYKTGTFKLAAQGKFPQSLIPFVFSTANGWKKITFESHEKMSATYYQVKTARKSLQASIPFSGLIFAASDGIREILTVSNSFNKSDFLPTLFDEKTRYLMADNSGSAIRFFAPGAKLLIPHFLRADITFPVEYAAGTCTPVYADKLLSGYTVAVNLQFLDSRFVRPAAVLLRNVLKSFPKATITITDELCLSVSDVYVNLETIARIR